MSEVAYAGKLIASAITPLDVVPGQDATGVTVASLTEAVVGMTAALVRIADAIQNVADATEALDLGVGTYDLTQISISLDNIAEAIQKKK